MNIYKSYPAVTTIHSQQVKWGFFELTELLEVINNLRARHWDKPPLSAQELFTNFVGMNIYRGYYKTANRILVYWIGEGETRYNWVSEEWQVDATPDPEKTWKILVPANWGERTMAAVERGGERATCVAPKQKNGRPLSRVVCHREHLNFDM